MLKSRPFKILPLFAALAIPLGEKDKWSEISFNKIPPNTVTYSPASLKVQVKKSASPLVYKLPVPARVTGFDLILRIKGDIKSQPLQSQVEEDSLFRFGLVAEGTKTLSGAKKFFAADWIKKLFALADDSAGLDKIYFFNLGRSDSQLGLKREHPKSELMLEEIVAVRKVGDEQVKFSKQLAEPLKTAAIWLSVDGDDTQSEFETTIESITLRTVE